MPEPPFPSATPLCQGIFSALTKVKKGLFELGFLKLVSGVLASNARKKIKK
jgi:hypothetical protein